MTPSSTQCIPNQLNFGTIKGRKVIANFNGGKITSDAGIVLMAELDKKLKITARFAQCFRDYRDLSYVNYSVDAFKHSIKTHCSVPIEPVHNLG